MSLDWSHWIILLLLFTIGCALTFEVIYFMRTFICVIMSRYFKKSIHILDKCSVRGICLSRDVDAMLDHMNNSRYLRELDFARIDFYMRTGLYDEARKQKGNIVLINAYVRFQKYLGLFKRFKITTKVLYWTEDSLYLEHKFISDNGTVNAALLCQQYFVKCNGETIMENLLKKGNPVLVKPEIPAQVSKFLELQDVTKKTLITPLA